METAETSRPSYRRIAIPLLALGVYVVSYLPVHAAIGNPVGMLIVVPILLSAVLFGHRAGVCSVFIALIVNTVMANLTGTPGLLAVVHRGGLPGFVAILILTAIIGRLRDAGEKIKVQHAALEVSLHQLAHAQEKLVRAEKLVALAKFAGSMQHELNTPLSSLRSNVSFVADATHVFSQVFEAAARLARQGLVSTDNKVERLARETQELLQPEQHLVEDLRTATQDSAADMQRIRLVVENLAQLHDAKETPGAGVNLDRFLTETFANLSAEAETAVQFDGSMTTGASVRMVQRDLRQAISNVLTYFKRRGSQTVPLRVHAQWASGYPCLSISHPDLTLDVAERTGLVDPVIRADFAGETMRADLGLAFAFQLAARGGAELHVDGRDQHPTAFRFVFTGAEPLELL